MASSVKNKQTSRLVPGLGAPCLRPGSGQAWFGSPQDVVTDEPAVVAVGAGDEEKDLPGALHAA